jgi:hypothetical protein
MEFHINKGSTLPILKLELIQDGRNDYNKFHEMIQNANLYFTLTNIVTGVKIIAKKPTDVMEVIPESCIGSEFYLTYKFTERDTSKPGRYIGEFTIEFADDYGTLIVPIRETLFVNILDQGIKK